MKSYVVGLIFSRGSAGPGPGHAALNTSGAACSCCRESKIRRWFPFMIMARRLFRSRGASSRLGMVACCSSAALYLGAQAFFVTHADGGAAVAASARRAAPLATFGVIADVQYVDAPDGSNYKKTVKRHYRGSLEVLRRAVAWWNAEPRVDFVANLGDVVDGQCARLGQSESALRTVVHEFGRCAHGGRVAHLVGNHELYNFPDRDALDARLGHRAGGPTDYYAFSVGRAGGDAAAPRVRVLCLDPYQIALMSTDEAAKAEALRRLKAHNPNDVEHAADWTQGLRDGERHWVPYNGALGAEQLRWLAAELASAEAAAEPVVVLSHTPLHPGACDGTTMAWDWEDALATIDAHAGNVVAIIAGHDHKGGYHRDRAGVHHITLKSPLNLGSLGECYGLVEVHESAIEIHSPRLGDLLPPTALQSEGVSTSGQPDVGSARVPGALPREVLRLSRLPAPSR